MKLPNYKMIICFIIFAVAVSAQENDAVWKEACEAYDKADYQLAISKLSILRERGIENPELYYNLGNSYFKAKNLGMAIWSFRRSLKLESNFKPASNNLEMARSLNLDQQLNQGKGFIAELWGKITGLLTLNEFLILFTISWLIIATLLTLIIIRKYNAAVRYYLLIVMTIIAIFSLVAIIDKNVVRNTRYGVLVIPSADIREGPSGSFEKIEVLHEGSEFKIISEREDNILIELQNSLKGWLPKQAVFEI